MISLFICGDIVNCENMSGSICSGTLAELVSAANYGICNFEGPLTGFGKPQPKIGPNLSQRPETISGLKSQGFNLLLLANNHIMDFGVEALVATIEAAQETGMDTLGAGLTADVAYTPLIKVIGGYRLGMINASEAQFGVIDYFKRRNEAGYAWINHHLVDRTIIALKDECDFVIVFSHAGLEHYSIPQKEWRARYRHFCELGADVVVGSHPHVPQGYEVYKKSLIFYSLGNFYFDYGNYKNKEDCSYALWLELRKDQPVTFNPIFHYKDKGCVHLSPYDKHVDLKNLCSMLDKNYSELHDEMSLEAYDFVRQYLLLSLTPFAFDGGIIRSLRRIVARFRGRNWDFNKELMLLHLLKNEAYYFAARHALEIMARETIQK